MDSSDTKSGTVEVDHGENSLAGTKTNVNELTRIQEASIETTTEVLKSSLLEEDSETKIESISDSDACITKNTKDSIDKHHVLQVNVAAVSDDNVLEASVDFVDEPNVPNNNCTSLTSLSKSVIELNKDVQEVETVNNVASEGYKVDKIDVEEQANVHSTPEMNKLYEDSSNNVATKNEDGESDTTKKLSNEKHLLNVARNSENFQNVRTEDAETDRETSSHHNATKINLASITMAIKREQLINEVDEIVIDEKSPEGEKCSVFHEGLSSKSQNAKQEQLDSDSAKLIGKETESSVKEKRKVDVSIVKSSELTQDGINGLTDRQTEKEKSPSNNVECIDITGDEVNATTESYQNDKTSETCTISADSVRQEGKRKSNPGCLPPVSNALPLHTTPKGGKGRGRGGGNFEVTKELLKPFKLGWLREVVERATCNSPKKMWDVYYRSPDGTKKMRSMPDVINYLKSHPESGLSRENFTFFKTHIYREPFELTRKARMRPNSQSKSPATSPKKEKSKPVTPLSASVDENKSNVSVHADKPSTKKTKLNNSKDKSTAKDTSILHSILESDEKPHIKKVTINLTKDESITNKKSSLITEEEKKKMPEKCDVTPVSSRRSKRIHKHKPSHLVETVVPEKAPNIYEKIYTKLSRPRSDYSRSLRKLNSVTPAELQDKVDDKVKENDVTKNKIAVSKHATVLVSHLNEKTNKLTIKLPTDTTDLNKSPKEKELSDIDGNLCSNRCPGCVGEIPSLQCIVCLCLFHPSCMGFNKSTTNFICKRCSTIKYNKDLTQKNDKQKRKDVMEKTQCLEQNDSDSTDEDANVSVLAPEVVMQHEGSDQEEIDASSEHSYCFSQSSARILAPTVMIHHKASDKEEIVASSGQSYCFSQTPTRITSSNTMPSQYQQDVLNGKSNFIRQAPPLTPIPSLAAPTHHLPSSKRVTASSTYFPPPVGETSVLRATYSKLNTFPQVSSTLSTATCPVVASTIPNVCHSLIGSPPVGSSVRMVTPQQLMNASQPPPLCIPRPAMVQNPVRTGPPPLRLVTPRTVSSSVGNSSKLLLPNSGGSCLVFAPNSNVISPGATTRLIGPFTSKSLPHIMVVNNKIIYVNPIANQQLTEPRSHSILPNMSSTVPHPPICSSKDILLETKAKPPENNSYLSSLLNKPNTSFNLESESITIPLSSSVPTTSTVTFSEGKVSSMVTPKLTAVIPPSFPSSKSSSSVLRSLSPVTTTAAVTTTAGCLTSSTVSLVCDSNVPLELPAYAKTVPLLSNTLAKKVNERFKMCLSTTPKIIFTDTSSSGLLSSNTTKRMETSTTPAIKSPMTTSRLLKGTESSLLLPEAKSPIEELNNSNSEPDKKKMKLFIPVSSPSSLNIENKETNVSVSFADYASVVGVEQKNRQEENSFNNVTCNLRDETFRTTFTPKFDALMNTMTSCYSCLNNIFQFLTTPDLLRVKLVCKSWYRLASQQFLWRKVSLKNLIITDWRKFANALELHGTTYLDLRGHVLLHDTWQNFVSVLNRLEKLQHVGCGLIPAFVLYAMASKLVHLRSLTGECAMFSYWTNGRVGPCVINFNLLENFREMEKFQLRCQEGLMATVIGGLLPISHLSKLRHLSLTTLQGVDSEQFVFLNKLNNLETLEIGDCSSWTAITYSFVGKMVNLQVLRLEKGGEVDGMADALSNLKRLKELHLVVYKIPPNLGTALQRLEMLSLLSLWPDTSSNGPYQNHKALHAVSYLSQLKELRWIILSNSCEASNKSARDEGEHWRPRLEDFEECQINFSDPNDEIPLVPFAETNYRTYSKPRSVKNAPRCITVKGLRESLQEALPSTEIKMFQVSIKQFWRYSAFR